MSIPEQKVNYKITANATPAQQALNALTADLNKVGGTFTAQFGGMIPVASAVAGAVTSVGVAAVGAGLALFNITKNAAEFGSTIFDASQKTGLGATAISSLKVAAEQSGSSLEAVTKGIAKFAKGYAGTGKDIQTELGKVMTQIANAKPGFEQLTLAQKAFGKSGADLIPMIRSFDGDLPGLIKHMSDLGVTIDDKAAIAADDFGDKMDMLDAQLAGVGHTIGTALMPEFLRMAGTVSNWVSQNKDNISELGSRTATFFDRLITGFNATKTWIDNHPTITRLLFGVFTGGLSEPVGNLAGQTGSGIEYLTRPGKAQAGENIALGSAVNFDSYDPESKRTGGRTAKQAFKLSSQGKALVDAANKLGVSPLDLATIIGFETAGTYSPSKTNQYGYKGLIQFGAAEQAKYGVSSGQSFEQQVTTSVVKFLQDRFAQAGRSTAGASLLDLYRTVLGGNPNASLTKTDANGVSPLTGVRRMLRDHRPAALDRFFGGNEANAKGGGWGGDYAKTVEDEKRNNDKIYENERLAASRRLELGQALTNDLIDQYETLYQKAVEVNDPTQAIAAAKYLHDLKIQYIDDEIAGLDEVWRSAEIGSEKEAEAWHKLQLATIARNAAQRKADEVLAEQRKKITEKQIDDALKLQEKALADFEAFAATLENKAHTTGYSMVDDAAARGRKRLADKNTAHPLSDGIFGSLGISKMQTEADIVSGIYGRMGSMVGDTVNQMAQGVGSMVEQWVLYGSAGPDAMRKMTASVLAGLAAQAAVESLMELAKGIASLATPFTAWQAPFHFKAAAIFGGIAVGSALAGRAVAGDSFTKGNASSSGSASGSTGSTGSASVMPSSRVSANAFTSGRDSSTVQLAASIDRLERKISGMRPGDVLVAGAREKRGFIGEQNTRDIQSNAKIGVNQAKAMGMR